MTRGAVATSARDGEDGRLADPTVEPDPGLYQAIVETSASPFVVVDHAGTVTWASANVLTLLGRAPQTVVGRPFLEVIAEPSRDAAVSAFGAFVASGDRQPWVGPPMLVDLVRADGSPVTCEVSAALGQSHGIDGAILHIRRWRGTVLLHDAVDALASGAPLEKVLERLIALLEHDAPGSAASVAVGWDGASWASVVHGAITAAAGAPLTGPAFAGPDGVSRALDRTSGPTTLAQLAPALGEAARAAGFADCWVFPVHERDDEAPTAVVAVWRTIPGRPSPHLTTTPERVVRLVGLALRSAATRAAWEREARTDALTGLANRGALGSHLAGLDAGDLPRTILFCDLDGFKAINDRYGHVVGDQALAAVAARIGGSVRPGDLAVRWGGDEFAVLCGGDVDPRVLAERIIERVNEPLVVAGHRITVGVSIGAATSAHAEPIEALLARGDRALRSAKAAGKNQLRIAT